MAAKKMHRYEFFVLIRHVLISIFCFISSAYALIVGSSGLAAVCGTAGILGVLVTFIAYRKVNSDKQVVKREYEQYTIRNPIQLSVMIFAIVSVMFGLLLFKPDGYSLWAAITICVTGVTATVLCVIWHIEKISKRQS
jgi:spore maturation protein SpmB